MSAHTVEPDGGREVNPLIARAILGYVEVAMGPDGLEAFVGRLPGGRSVAEMTDPTRWWTLAEVGHVVAVALEVTRDRDLGRRLGEQVYRDLLGGSNAELIRLCGTAEVACQYMADYSTRMEPTRSLRVVESSASHVVLEGRFDPSVAPNTISCGFTGGFFGSLPGLFGSLGTVVETSCQGDGDEVCRFRVAWRPDPSALDRAEAPDTRVISGHSAIEQLENQHQLAARLVDAHEVDAVLERVVSNVSGTVGARQFLLSVRLEGSAGPRIHQVGFAEEDAVALAARVDAGDPLGDQHVVADIERGDRRYGRLVAVYPPGVRASIVDERGLASYAAFAAAAIQIVEALDAARRDRDTARSLLSLASALSETTEVAAIAENLCLALPAAAECDLAGVWLADPDDGSLRLVECRDADGSALAVDTAEPAPQLAAAIDEAVRAGRPMLVGGVELDRMGRSCGQYTIAELAVVPVTNGPTVAGAAIAAWSAPLPGDRRVGAVERLGGLADQAAVAFENARLVEAMRYQALHDDLTGLPKRVLAEDRCRVALSRRDRHLEEVALLFVDVDDFKAINDSLGHTVGDELLRQLAERLRAQLRSSDTCARIGGDEFVVVATGAPGDDGADQIAERILRALDAPFTLDGRSLNLSVSVGIARASDNADTFETLLRRADEAMYGAKAAGKRRVASG